MKWTQSDLAAKLYRVPTPVSGPGTTQDLTDAAFGDLGVMVMDLEASDPYVGVLFNHAGLNGVWRGPGYPGDTHGF